MATVIDALVMTLGLDTRGLKKGERETADTNRRLRDDAEKTRKAYELAGQRVAQSITSARNAALGLAGVFTAGAGLASFIRQTTESSAAIGRMARDLNMSTQALSAWEGVSRRVGNAAGEVTGAFEAIQNQIQQFRLLGAGGLSPAFRALNVSLADAQGRVRDNEDIYRDVLRALAQRPAQERLTIARALGMGQETVNLAALPEPQRNAMLAEQRRLGVVSPEQAAAAQRRQRAWLDFQQALQTTANRLLTDFTPAIVFVLEKLRDFGTYLSGPTFRPAFEAIERAVRRVATYLGSQDFLDDVQAFINAIRDMGAALLEFLRWLGILSRPENPDDPSNFIRGPDGTMNWVRGPNGEPVARPNPNPGADRGTGLRTGMGGATGTPTNADAAQRERAAYNYLRSQGYTHEQAAGITANIRQESNFNPTLSHEADGRGFGLVGWNNDGQGPGRPGRLTRLGEHVARLRNLPAPTDYAAATALARTATFDEQLRFIGHELSPEGDERAAGARIRAATTANEAGREGVGWLRPARGVLERARRGNMADDVARRMAEPPPPAPGATPTTQAPATPPRQMTPAEAAAAALGVRVTPPTVDPNLVTGPDGAALRDNVRPNQTSNNEANIGTINVQTAATDAGGIARDIGAALARTTFVDQATRGLA